MKIFSYYFCPGVTNSSLFQGLGEIRALRQLRDFKRLRLQENKVTSSNKKHHNVAFQKENFQLEDVPKHIFSQECLLKERKYKRKNIAKEKKIHLTQTTAIFLPDKSKARWLE